MIRPRLDTVDGGFVLHVPDGCTAGNVAKAIDLLTITEDGDSNGAPRRIMTMGEARAETLAMGIFGTRDVEALPGIGPEKRERLIGMMLAEGVIREADVESGERPGYRTVTADPETPVTQQEKECQDGK